MVDDFELFSEQALYVVTFAQEDGQRSGDDSLLTKHLLVGLMNHTQGNAMLAALNVPVPRAGSARPRSRQFIGPPAPLELSPSVKRVAELAREEINDPDMRSDESRS